MAENSLPGEDLGGTFVLSGDFWGTSEVLEENSIPVGIWEEIWEELLSLVEIFREPMKIWEKPVEIWEKPPSHLRFIHELLISAQFHSHFWAEDEPWALCEVTQGAASAWEPGEEIWGRDLNSLAERGSCHIRGVLGT